MSKSIVRLAFAFFALCGVAYTAQAPAQAQDKDDIQHHIGEVENQLQGEPDVGTPQPDEPTQKGVVGQGRRRRPDTPLAASFRWLSM